MNEAVTIDNAGATIEGEPREIATVDERAAPPAPTSDDPILAAILAAARDPQVDIEKFRALKGMYDEERRYRAEVEFNAAMQEAQAEMVPVLRDRTNTQTASKYATIEAIAKEITPIYTRHGFSMSFGQGETNREGHLRITGELKHRNGHTTTHFTDVPIDAAGIQGKRNKTDTHAFGSTMSYGRRYLKLLVWDIATADDDGNAAGAGPKITEDEAATLRELVDEVGRTESAFVNYLNNRKRLAIKTLDDLPASMLDEARQFLAAIKQKQAADTPAEAEADDA